MLTPDQQSRRAVLLASLENALEFHQHVLELRELLELERKDAAETVRVVSCDWCGGWDTTARIVKSGDYEVCRACAKDPPEKLRTILENRPQPCLDETKMHGYCDQFGGSDDPNDGFTGELIPNPRTYGVARARAENEPEWRRQLERLLNTVLFALFNFHLDEYQDVDTRGAIVGNSTTGGANSVTWAGGTVLNGIRPPLIAALWPLEQLRRNVLAKSPTIVIPEEIAALMPGDYVVPHGSYKYESTKQSPYRWLYQGDCGDVASIEESTERILAAIDKRGTQILADGELRRAF